MNAAEAHSVETRELIRDMMAALDFCLPALETAAAQEARQPKIGGALKRITHQKRLEHVRSLIARADANAEGR